MRRKIILAVIIQEHICYALACSSITILWNHVLQATSVWNLIVSSIWRHGCWRSVLIHLATKLGVSWEKEPLFPVDGIQFWLIHIFVIDEIIVIPNYLGCCHRNCLRRFRCDWVPEHKSRKLHWLCVATILCWVSPIQVIVVKSSGVTLSVRHLHKTGAGHYAIPLCQSSTLLLRGGHELCSFSPNWSLVTGA